MVNIEIFKTPVNSILNSTHFVNFTTSCGSAQLIRADVQLRSVPESRVFVVCTQILDHVRVDVVRNNSSVPSNSAGGRCP